jgi:LmbE family N-acetylglucosaminyl deacetylase
MSCVNNRFAITQKTLPKSGEFFVVFLLARCYPEKGLHIQQEGGNMTVEILRRNEFGSAMPRRTIVEAIGLEPNDPGTFLILAPHDDDPVLSAGYSIMLARAAGAKVHICIVTDGAMGYQSLREVEEICKTRRKETYAAYAAFGVHEEHISWLKFPDGGTSLHIGCFLEGMEMPLTELIRQIRPSAVFTTCPEDRHPDHQNVNKEGLMSLCHGVDGIWTDRGKQIDPPVFVEWRTYTAYLMPKILPTIGILADDDLFQRKLTALACWKSQAAIIDSNLNRQPLAGREEYLWVARPFDPSEYSRAFGW